MIVKYLFKDLDNKEEELLREYFEKKLPNIEKYLQNFGDDAATLNLNLSRFEKHNAYSCELILKLPKKTIVSKEASHSINKSIDFAKDRLIRQIVKHDASLKKEHLMKRQHRKVEPTADRLMHMALVGEEAII